MGKPNLDVVRMIATVPDVDRWWRCANCKQHMLEDEVVAESFACVACCSNQLVTETRRGRV